MRIFCMKPKRIALVLILCIGLFAACGQKKEETETVSEQPVVKEEITETEVTTEESTEEVISKGFIAVPVKDISEIKQMRSWLEYFYYNNLFDKNLNNETGEISEDAMMSFAASYIMQLEHQGLRFDPDTFRLYIPQKQLEEVVLRFFDKKITEHRSLSEHGILFEEEHYVIQADSREWPTRLDMLSVTEIAPKVYSSVLNGNNTEIGQIDHQIKAEFQWAEDHYVLKKYQMISDPAAFVSGNPLDLGNPEENERSGERSSQFSENEEEAEASETPEATPAESGQGETAPAQ